MNLFPHETPHAWHRLGTQDFSSWVERDALCLIPVCALCERAGGAPLDLDEQICGRVLADVLKVLPEPANLLIMPPLTQVPLQEPGQVFTLELETASQLAEALLASAVQTGFQRFCFVHLSESLTDWLDGLGRDLRVAHDITVYRLGLHSLGIEVTQSVTPEQIESVAHLLHPILLPQE